MRRRTFLVGSATTLALPAIARAKSKRILKFIPQSDLAILDPVWTTAYVTRNHGYMVFDTLYGQTGQEDGFRATPQMAAGHDIENDGKTWKLTLRDALQFHNGERVLASDCVASIKRWGARDAFGQALMARTDELIAPDDKTIVFRLKQPLALLPDALGHGASNMCAIMPKHIAETDPFKQVTEIVGSGPFRFKPDERVQGSRFAETVEQTSQPITLRTVIPRQRWIAGEQVGETVAGRGDDNKIEPLGDAPDILLPRPAPLAGGRHAQRNRPLGSVEE
jgi:peptide/nickel transport system substrate-binding protein